MSNSDADRNLLQRQQMVKLIQQQGVTDPCVCAAMLSVRRDAFVPPELLEHAYDDTALPIGNQQTIS